MPQPDLQMDVKEVDGLAVTQEERVAWFHHRVAALKAGVPKMPLERFVLAYRARQAAAAGEPVELEDVRRQPWKWHNFGYGWMLIRRNGPRKVVLKPVYYGGTVAIDVRNPDGSLVELTPEHPIARMLERAPEMLEVCLAVAGSPLPDGEDLTVDAARRVLALMGVSEEEAADAAR